MKKIDLPKFYVVSDLHIDEYKRFAKIDKKTGLNTRLINSLKVFDAIETHSESTECKNLIIAGDLFDKRGIISVKAWQLTFEKLQNLEKNGWSVSIVAGNHDQATRDGQYHALNGLCQNVFDKPRTLRASEIFKGYTGEIWAGFMPYFEYPDKFINWLSTLHKMKQPKIYFMHQGVNGAIIAGDEIIAKDEVGIGKIIKVVGRDTLIFSGHYHRHQKLSDNFYYCGSATPKDFGDTTPKGFLYFDGQNVEHVENKLAPKFVTVEVETSKDLEKCKKEIKNNFVQVKFQKDFSTEDVASLEAEDWVAIKSKVERTYSEESLEIGDNFTKTMQSYLQTFKEIDQTFFLNYYLEKTKNSQMVVDSTNSEIKLISLEINNFFSFKNSKIDFTKFSKVSSIEGDNQDDLSANDNGSGKSTIPEAIKWAIFGTTERGVSADDVVNKSFGKDCYVSLSLQVNGEDYTITRYRKHKKFKNEIRFFQGNHDLCESKNTDIQNKILQTLKTSEAAFSSLFYIHSQFLKPYAALSDKQQKEILEKIIGLSFFAENFEIFKNLSSELNKHYDLIRSEILICDKNKDFEIKQIEEHKYYLNDATEELERERKALTSTKNDLENKVSELQTLVDCSKKNLEEKKSEIKKLQTKSTAELESQIKKVLDKIKNKKDDVLSDLQVAKTEIEVLSREILKLKKSSEKDLCETCGQKIKVSKKIFEDIKTLSLEREEIQLIVDDLNKEASLYDVKATKYKDKLERVNKANEKLYLAKHDLDRLRNKAEMSFDKLESAKNSLLVLENQFSERTEKIEYRIEIIQEKINDCEERADKQDKLKTEKRKQLSEIEKESYAASFFKNAFSDKGSAEQSPIKTFIFNSILPFLDEKAQYYSNIISEGSVEVRFNTMSKTKSGEWRDKFSVDVINKYGAESYLGDSSGERRKVDIAIMFTLYSLARQRYGNKFDCMFLDEVFDSLDQEGCERISKVLKEFEKEIEKIFVITHNPHIKQFIKNGITVTKKEGTSTIE